MSEPKKSKLNQSMDLCKLIASVFVVLIHAGLPGEAGDVANCLARFAVPVFFAISGYFSFDISRDKIKSRAISILKINIIATVIYAVWQCWRMQAFGGVTVNEYLQSCLTERGIANWIIVGVNPFAGHLWYLSAILTCYVFLWIYVSFSNKERVNYNTFYVIGAAGMMIHVALGTNSAAAGQAFSNLIYRNALFFGIPMFASGMFIREYGQRIKERFSLNSAKEIGIVLFGVALSLLQWKGLGVAEMPIGTLIEAVGLMLLMSNHPRIASQRHDWIFRSFGNISLAVYVVHLFFVQLINSLSQGVAFFNAINSDEWLKPIAVIVFSLFSGILYDLLLRLLKKLKR